MNSEKKEIKTVLDVLDGERIPASFPAPQD